MTGVLFQKLTLECIMQSTYRLCRPLLNHSSWYVTGSTVVDAYNSLSVPTHAMSHGSFVIDRPHRTRRFHIDKPTTSPDTTSQPQRVDAMVLEQLKPFSEAVFFCHTNRFPSRIHSIGYYNTTSAAVFKMQLKLLMLHNSSVITDTTWWYCDELFFQPLACFFSYALKQRNK